MLHVWNIVEYLPTFALWDMYDMNVPSLFTTIHQTPPGWWFQSLWKIWVRQLGWWNSQLNGKIIQSCSRKTTNQISISFYIYINPNKSPFSYGFPMVFMFQTTHQPQIKQQFPQPFLSFLGPRKAWLKGWTSIFFVKISHPHRACRKLSGCALNDIIYWSL